MLRVARVPRSIPPLLYVPISIILLICTGFIPNERILDNLKTDIEKGRFHLADYPRSPDGLVVRDQYTECIAATMGIPQDGAWSPSSPLKGEMIGNCFDLAALLKLEADQNPGFPTQTAGEPRPYSRFWHGYQIFTRPILWMGGWSLLLALTTLTLCVAVYGYLSAFASGSERLSAALLLGSMFIGLDVRSILESPLVLIFFAVLLLLTSIFIKSIKTTPSQLSAILVGFFLNFFFMLVNQGVAFVFILISLVIALRSSNKITDAFSLGISQLLGVLLGWIGGFILRLVVWLTWEKPTEIIHNLQSSTINAQLPVLEGQNSAQRALIALQTNADYWLQLGSKSVFLVIAAALTLSTAILILLARQLWPVALRLGIEVGAITAALLVYLVVFATHSTLHAIFVWRIIPTYLAGILAISFGALSLTRTQKVPQNAS